MLPDRCSVKKGGKLCVNPPEFVISVASGDGEYMVGVTCGRHKRAVREKLGALQGMARIPEGKITFTELRPVGTDCTRASDDDLIGL